MSTPTCWYCPECGCGVDGDHTNQFPEHHPGKQVVLVPGVDLPAALRKAGHDVTQVFSDESPERYYVVKPRVLPDEKEAT